LQLSLRSTARIDHWIEFAYLGSRSGELRYDTCEIQYNAMNMTVL